MTELAVVIPSRGRPESVAKQGQAWLDTEAAYEADLIWAIDRDDPMYQSYLEELKAFPWMRRRTVDEWMPMVQKLNLVATEVVQDGYLNAGFMGDDHLPRSKAWHVATSGWLAAAGVGIMYGRDGFQDARVPTWWMMTSNIVQALGRMVPANVQHLYCDNSIQVLGVEARCLAYLPHVFIEHMHPVAGKSAMDAGYQRVNRPDQYQRDAELFDTWMRGDKARDVKIIQDLRRTMEV